MSTAVVVTMAAAGPSGATGDRSGAFTIRSQGFEVRSQAALPSGNATAVYTRDGVTLTVAAPAGSAVDLDAGDASATAAVTTPDPKTSPTSAYVGSGQSLIDNALAVGFTPKQALRVAQNLDVHLTSAVTVAGLPLHEAQARWGGGSPHRTSTGLLETARSAPIVNSPCLTLTGDSDQATSRFCDVQRKVQASGSDWYLGDAGTGTASDVDGWKLTEFRGDTAYSSGNSEVQWRPNATVSIGSCASKTFGITYNGATVSSTAVSCPDSLDPYLGSLHFGVNWSGCNHKQDGIAPVDLVHSPPTAGAGITVDIKIAWASWTSSCT
jgi:hypothetical protein